MEWLIVLLIGYGAWWLITKEKKKVADQELRFWSPDPEDGYEIGDPEFTFDFQEMTATLPHTDPKTKTRGKLFYDIKRDGGEWRLRLQRASYLLILEGLEFEKVRMGDNWLVDPDSHIQSLKKQGLDWWPPHSQSNKCEGQYQRYLASLR